MRRVVNPRLTHQPAATHLPTQRALKELKAFTDKCGHAVSFYFRAGENAKRDVGAIRLKTRELISKDFEDEHRNYGLLRDMDHCLEIAEESLKSQSSLRVVFACHEHGIWQEFTLPASCRILYLETGNKFNLLPLADLFEGKQLDLAGRRVSSHII